MTKKEFLRFRFYYSIGMQLEFRFLYDSGTGEWHKLKPKSEKDDCTSQLSQPYSKTLDFIEYRLKP